MLAALTAATANAADVRMPVKAPWQPPQAYDWTGLYVGGHFGYAGGRSSWSSTPGLASSFGLYQGLDMFTGEGSYFGGLQVGLGSRIISAAAATAYGRAWAYVAAACLLGLTFFLATTILERIATPWRVHRR